MKISVLRTTRLTNGACMAYYDRLLECVNGDETVKRLFPEYVTCLQEAYEELDTRFQGAVKSVLVAKIKRGNVLMDNLYVVFKRKVRLLGRLAENQSEKDMADTLLNLLEASNVRKERKNFRKLGVFCGLVSELGDRHLGAVAALGLEGELALMQAQAEKASRHSALRMEERQTRRDMPVAEARQRIDRAMRALLERVNAALLLGIGGTENLSGFVDEVNALNYDYRLYELKAKTPRQTGVTGLPLAAGMPVGISVAESPTQGEVVGTEREASASGGTPVSDSRTETSEETVVTVADSRLVADTGAVAGTGEDRATGEIARGTTNGTGNNTPDIAATGTGGEETANSSSGDSAEGSTEAYVPDDSPFHP